MLGSVVPLLFAFFPCHVFTPEIAAGDLKASTSSESPV